MVQEVIDKLPHTIQIPVPTPKGKQPVYPRMLFLRREVLAPGQAPLKTAAPPSKPEVGQNEILATPPNPWTIGTTKPEPMPDRPTVKRVVPLTRKNYVSKAGEVFDHCSIKWLKDNSKAWIMLVDFDRKALPEANLLASVKLILYVHESHNRAPMQAAAVALRAAFEPGKPFDFAKLGDRIGWTVVEKGAGPHHPFIPPKRYEIDVTKEIRRWARGEQGHGLALRTVPNRGIDDGWTVRFTLAKEKPAEFEIATYAD